MSNSRSIFGRIVVLAVLLMVFAAVLNRQLIADQIRVLRYSPSTQIIGLTNRSSFTDLGKFYFFAAQPEIEASEAFNNDCRRVEQGSPILGCYDESKERIHIFNIQEPALDGIKEVTAAHEMLHVVYSRLSSSERKKLEPELDLAYQSLKTNELEERMAYYKRSQPGSRYTELHSILATEFRDIGGPLEKYYAKYFVDRENVVALHEKSSSQFEILKRQSRELAESLASRKQSIDQQTRNYQARLADYNERVNVFNQRAQNGGFTSQYQFESERRNLEAQQQAIEYSRRSLEQSIASYNTDIEKVNILGKKLEQLNNSLDSTKAVE